LILLARAYTFVCHKMTSYRTALFTACYDSVRRRVDLISSLFEFYAANLTHVNLLCGVSGDVFTRSSEWRSGAGRDPPQGAHDGSQQI
jgi:hypothetical protein